MGHRIMHWDRSWIENQPFVASLIQFDIVISAVRLVGTCNMHMLHSLK